MARLIDADALKDSLKESYERLRKIYDCFQKEDEKRICGAQLTTFTEAILRVKNAPTIDAVPVVRCKDCKFATPYTTDGIMHHVSCEIFQLYMPDDWYCVNGTMKDGGADDAAD